MPAGGAALCRIGSGSRHPNAGPQASAGSHPQPKPLRRGHTNFGAVKQFCRRTRAAGNRAPTARLVRLAARPLYRASHRAACGGPERPGVRPFPRQGAPAHGPGPLRPTGSCGCPVPRWPALIAASGSPQWGPGCGQSFPLGRRAVRASPGGRPGACPRRPRRAGRIAPGISASFQFLPTSGGNQGAEGVQVTLRGCRDFRETKKRIENPPSSSFPEGKGAPPTPGPQLPSSGPQVEQEPDATEGTHPRDP